MFRVAVITGSNKGIGLAIVKGLCQKFDGIVYLTSRNNDRGKEAVEELNKLGLNPNYHQLDVTDRNSIIRLRNHIKEKYGGLDVLINNAGIIDSDFFSSSYEYSKNVIDINFKSVLTMQELIYPLVRNNGRILNISSSCGHLSNLRNKYWIDRLSKNDLTIQDLNEFIDWFLESKRNGTFNPADIADGATIAAYKISKVALSALTKIQQKKLESKNISVNSLYPGLVRTGMTSGVGFYSTDQAAETPIYLILEAPQALKGAYVWHDRSVVDWYDYKSDYNFKIKNFLDLQSDF